MRMSFVSGSAVACAALAFAFGGMAQAASEVKFDHVMNIGTEGTGEGQFKYVEDFAFTKNGHLLVTDAVHALVQVFDKTTGKFISRFGGKGDDDAISTSLRALRSIRTATSSSPTTTPASSRSTTRPTIGC